MLLQVKALSVCDEYAEAFIACLYGNNENEFVYRTIERDLIEEEDIIDQGNVFLAGTCIEKCSTAA